MGWPKLESNSGKSMECSENDDGGKISLAFFTQLNDCNVEAKLAIDKDAAAIISGWSKCLGDSLEMQFHQTRYYANKQLMFIARLPNERCMVGIMD